MTATTSLLEIARRDLADLNANIVGPGDPDYDATRAVHNGMIDRHPAVIVRCSSADEVARCVAFARAHDTLIAVRGGGHNGGGLGAGDDGIVVDLSGLAEVTVDPESDRVRVGGGCTWGDVDRATTSRSRYTLRDHLDDRCRRPYARRRNRPPDAPLRPLHRQPDQCDVVLADGSQVHTAQPRTPSCSGPFAGAAVTLVSSHRSSSARTQLAPW